MQLVGQGRRHGLAAWRVAGEVEVDVLGEVHRGGVGGSGAQVELDCAAGEAVVRDDVEGAGIALAPRLVALCLAFR